MKKIEMSIASKLKIIEDYLSSAGQIIYHNGEASTESYSIAIGRIYSASPRFLWEKISLLDEMIYSRNWEEPTLNFWKLARLLHHISLKYNKTQPKKHIKMLHIR